MTPREKRTPTRKRKHIYTMFQDLVEDMYRDDGDGNY